jgi:uncharacterized RDD family membrane protein YckC
MDAKFISIVERLVKEQGKEALIDLAKCKMHLADYSRNGYTAERHMLMIAIEAGAGEAIANADDLAIRKKREINFLKDERFVNEAAATEVIDLLAFVLRGDISQSIILAQSSNTQSQSAAKPVQHQLDPQNDQQQPQYNPPPNYYPPNAPYPPPQYPYNPQSDQQQPQYNPPPNYYPPNAPYPPPQQVKYVGFLERLAADIIDSIVMFAISYALGFVLGLIGLFNTANNGWFIVIVYIVGIVVAPIYTIGFWLSAQATPGKMAIGAKIVDAKTLGEPTAGQYIGRYLAYFISACFCCLGFLWIALDKQKRGWHDMLPGTLVVQQYEEQT